MVKEAVPSCGGQEKGGGASGYCSQHQGVEWIVDLDTGVWMVGCWIDVLLDAAVAAAGPVLRPWDCFIHPHRQLSS